MRSGDQSSNRKYILFLKKKKYLHEHRLVPYTVFSARCNVLGEFYQPSNQMICFPSSLYTSTY